jgi:hypothetical protein
MVVVRAITEVGDAEVRRRNTERQRTEAFQQESLSIQWLLFIATALAFGAAAYYAWTAKHQLDIMNETLKEAHIQNVAQQRADFTVNVNEAYSSSNYLAIRITNMGHVNGTLISYRTVYQQEVSYGATFNRERTVTLNPPEGIAAGSIYTIGISLPPTPTYIPTAKSPWSVSVIFYLTYDDGFGNEGTLRSCFLLQPTTRLWDSSCTWVTPVDLSKEPQTTQKKNK